MLHNTNVLGIVSAVRFLLFVVTLFSVAFFRGNFACEKKPMRHPSITITLISVLLYIVMVLLTARDELMIARIYLILAIGCILFFDIDNKSIIIYLVALFATALVVGNCYINYEKGVADRTEVEETLVSYKVIVYDSAEVDSMLGKVVRTDVEDVAEAQYKYEYQYQREDGGIVSDSKYDDNLVIYYIDNPDEARIEIVTTNEYQRDKTFTEWRMLASSTESYRLYVPQAFIVDGSISE